MKLILPPLNRTLPGGGLQATGPQLGQGGSRGNFSPLPGQSLPPTAADLPQVGGITQRVASLLAFARVIDFSTATVANQSTNFLNSTDAYRNYLMLRNASAAANIYIGFGTDASAFSTLRLIPGAIALFDAVVPQDDLYYFADAAAGTLCCAYSTVKADWKV